MSRASLPLSQHLLVRLPQALLRKAVIRCVLAAALVLPTPQYAHGITDSEKSCQVVFEPTAISSDPQTVFHKRLIEKARTFRTNLASHFRKPLDLNEFRAQRDAYINRLTSGETLDADTIAKTPLQKLALIEAIGATRGGDLFQLAAWLERATPGERQEMMKVVKRLNFEGRLSSYSKTEKALVRLYFLTHIPVRIGLQSRSGLEIIQQYRSEGLESIWKLMTADGVPELAMERARLSLARGLTSAFVELGFARSASSIERLKLKIRQIRRPLDMAWQTAKFSIAYYVPLLEADIPTWLDNARDLRPEDHGLYFDKRMADFEERVLAAYGRDARIQQQLNRFTHILGIVLMPLMGYLFWEELRELALMVGLEKYIPFLARDEEPENKTQSEEPTLTHAQREKLIEDLYQYELRQRIIYTAPLDETPVQKEIRLQQIKADPSLAQHHKDLKAMTDNELIGMAQN